MTLQKIERIRRWVTFTVVALYLFCFVGAVIALFATGLWGLALCLILICLLPVIICLLSVFHGVLCLVAARCFRGSVSVLEVVTYILTALSCVLAIPTCWRIVFDTPNANRGDIWLFVSLLSAAFFSVVRALVRWTRKKRKPLKEKDPI